MAKRKYGKSSHVCRLCGNTERVIRSHKMMICSRCFKEVSSELGFKKYT